MRILAITNLYPTPRDRQRGIFNRRLLDEVALKHSVRILALVPEWRFWRWAGIRRWEAPNPGNCVTYLPVFYLPLLGRDLSWRFYRRALQRRKAEFLASDAVLATWLYPDCVAAAAVARECGKPIWFKVHGSDRFHLDHPGRAARVLDACRYASGVLPNCDYLARELEKRGVEHDKIRVVRHGIDADVFRCRPREEALRMLGDESTSVVDPDAKMILFVGHLKKVKGPDLALKALAGIAGASTPSPSSVHSQLVFIGDGPLRAELESSASELGLGDRVVFPGSQLHDRVALWMNVADCLLLSSRSEGMPNVVIEALASGTPVVATDVGDVRSVLTEASGCVVSAAENESPGAIAAALMGVLDREWNHEAISAAVSGNAWSGAADKLDRLLSGSAGRN